MTIGEYIKQYRFEHGMSLRDFEQRSGISRSRLSHFESGKLTTPSFKTFAAIAAAMGLTVQELNERCGNSMLDNNSCESTLSEREELELIVTELSEQGVHTILTLLKELKSTELWK